MEEKNTSRLQQCVAKQMPSVNTISHFIIVFSDIIIVPLHEHLNEKPAVIEMKNYRSFDLHIYTWKGTGNIECN